MTTSHDEPTVLVPPRWVAALSVAVLGMSVAVLTPIQLLLPLQIQAIDPAHKVLDLGWITTVAAVVSIVTCPVAGALSDRTTSRFGRRRPWVLGSALVCAAGLVLLGGSHGIIEVALWWMLVQAGTNAMYAALSAAVPDRVPTVQRGVVSAFVGLPVPLALILGSFLVSTVVTGQFAGYLLLAVLLVVLVLTFVLSAEPVAALPTPAPRADPVPRGDIFWAFGCRFAIQVANAVGTLYLLFYLRDVIHRADPAKSLFLLISLYTVGIVLTSVIAGRWSDRVGRRKPFVIASSVVVACAMVVLGLGGTWQTAMVAAVLMGVGYGIYIAVDNALITQVLPSSGHRARDLGAVNLANTGPQAIAPAIAGVVITDLGGYTPLYLLAGACALVGAVLVQPVKGIR
jgi:MFS family permease